ncbi:LPS translocon maturation chaperone LptM [Pseudoxanthomonas koreensis]|uniref:LPS translocon maturation chaperone LptM n=1 Tax=Pseudoxanthomonas koreensis TaxID=266061 RepID=UPI001391F955|nr:lipoprotein [Pseudoxanthomonas koreensis]KAF1697167.1 sugar transporter [Pseudoxanthomonas koreensis]
MNTKTLCAAAVIALLLAACGNKGPLVMPQKPVPVEQESTAPPADATPTPAADPADATATPPADPPADPATDPTDPAPGPADGGNG